MGHFLLVWEFRGPPGSAFPANTVEFGSRKVPTVVLVRGASGGNFNFGSEASSLGTIQPGTETVILITPVVVSKIGMTRLASEPVVKSMISYYRNTLMLRQ